MAVWMVRAGEDEEAEAKALQKCVVIGWNSLPDLSAVESRDSLADLYRLCCPGESNRQVGNQVGQVWTFLRRIQVGDLVILPRKPRGRVLAVGEVVGPYRYATDLGVGVNHVLP